MSLFHALRRTFALLTPGERREGLLLTACLGLAAVAELASVAAFYPFLAVLADPGLVAADPRVAWLHGLFGAPPTGRFLMLLGGIVLAVTVAANAFVALTTWWLVRFTWRVHHSLSERLLARHLHRPYGDFLTHNSSAYAKQVLEETQTLVVNTLDPAFTMLGRLATILLIGGLLVALAPAATFALFVVLGGVYGALYLRMRRGLKVSGREALAANQARFQTVGEAFAAIKQVKVNGLEHRFHERYLPHSLAYARHQSTHHVLRRIPYYAMQTLAFGGATALVMVLLASGYETAEILPVMGVLAVGGFRLLPAFQQVLAAVVALRFTDPLIEAFHDNLAEPARATLARRLPGSVAGPRLAPQRRLRLEGVSFAYPTAARPTVDTIDLDIPAGSSVAFVGPTGAGKSTLVDVLLGLLPPDEGRVFVDDTPLGPDNLPAWQRAIGYVPQEIVLTDDTVAANIAFGVAPERVDRAAVERAARVAQIHDDIVAELPQGYDTQVGERGVRLSGGQRQRIGIARALYHDPPVLVLDEATSDIDNQTEAALTRAIEGLAGRKTVIVVAHRLATVRACATVHLLVRGRVVASGTYDELLTRESRFRDLALAPPVAGPTLTPPPLP